MKLRIISFSLLCLTFILAGCQAKQDDGTGISMSGTVTLDGKPVTLGQVMVYKYNGVSFTDTVATDILPDGTYSFYSVPAGGLKICVRTSMFKNNPNMNKGKSKAPAGKTGVPQAMEGTYVDVPSKYSKPDESPLSTETAGKGATTYNIEMKSDK
jgi:hypothetical protein